MACGLQPLPAERGEVGVGAKRRLRVRGEALQQLQANDSRFGIPKMYSASCPAPHPDPLLAERGEGQPVRPHSPIRSSHSSSVSTATPCFLASASFEPAPGPATT